MEAQIKKMVDELIKRKEEIRKLKEEIEEIERELLKSWFEKTESENYFVSTKKRVTYKLKKWIKLDFIMKNYPEVIEKKVNERKLFEVYNAKDLVNKKETNYIEVKKKK